MRSPVVRALVAVLVSAACSASPGEPGQSEGTSIPLCEAVPELRAPAEWYADSPIYVANEQPTEDLVAWAQTKPGFEDLWIDREHLGWVALAFSEDAEARQAELREAFPAVGAVVVPVEYSRAELDALQGRVVEALRPAFDNFSVGSSPTQGVVTIGIGVLSPDRIAFVEERFAGEPVCIGGVNPATLPQPGPQQPGGDGWRLLADQDEMGASYRTGIATDQASYEQLWADVGLAGDPPAVDFVREVVIWFGAVHGSSCPNIRFDGVVVDRAIGLVHANIVQLDVGGCTADAIPRAYVVAVERSKLPQGRFALQLGPDDPPAGVPEERTIVEADLTVPGAVAGPEQIHGDPMLPRPDIPGSGVVIEPDFPAQYRMNVRCGIEWLGEVNGVAWRVADPADATGGVPDAWGVVADREFVVLELLMRLGPQPSIDATANGHTVRYVATAEELPACR